MSGRQPALKASSEMYFSTWPMVTAPKPSLSVQAPSHRRSCGQTRPHTSGSELVWWRQFGRFEQAAFGHQLEPVGNVVVHRALPLAIRIAARQAAVGLFLRVRRVHRRIDFAELVLAHPAAVFSPSRRGCFKNWNTSPIRYALHCFTCLAGNILDQVFNRNPLRLDQPHLRQRGVEVGQQRLARALPVSARWRSTCALRKTR